MKPIKSFFALHKRVRRIKSLFSRGEKIRYFIVLVVLVFTALVEMAGIGAISPLVAVASDPGLIERNRILAELYSMSGLHTPKHFILLMAVGFALLIIGKNLLSLFSLGLYTHFTEMRKHVFGYRLMEEYLSRDYLYFKHQNSSDFTRKLINEVNIVARNFLYTWLSLVSQLFIAGAIICLLFIQSWKIALLAISVLGLLFGGLFSLSKGRLKSYGKIDYDYTEKRYKLLNDAFGGIKEVKILHGEKYFTGLFRKFSFIISVNNVKKDVMSVFPKHVVETVVFSATALFLAVMVGRDIDISQSLPSFALYIMAGYKLLPTLQKVSQFLGRITISMVSLDRLYDDLKEALSVPKKIEETPRIMFDNRIRFDGVAYRYPDATENVLSNIAFDIPKNSCIGIAGFSGAGKTTVVDLLAGLLLPTEGHIWVDGTPLQANNRRSWQKNIGYVPQNIFLTDTTIAENIAFGKDLNQIDLEAVKRAAQAAEIDQFIENELPKGYLTEAGEKGIRLSGGQRQRIVIARALFRDPELLIFDEATSAMDNKTEAAIMESIHRLSAKKTIVIIAHRLTTIEHCDEILVFKEGHLAAKGRYEELATENTVFKELNALQK